MCVCRSLSASAARSVQSLAAGTVILPCKAFLTNRQTLAALTVVALDVPHMMPAPPSGPWLSPPRERQQDRLSCGA